MTTVRDRLLPRVHAARALVGDLGMHQPQVLIRTASWPANVQSGGLPTTSDVILGAPSRVTPNTIVPPHVKGAPADPVIRVGPITPYHPTTCPTGFTLAQLNPADMPGIEYYYLVTWPGGIQKRYQLAPRGLDASRPMRIMLTLDAIDLDFAF